MVKTGADFFLRLPCESDQRILSRGCVAGVEGDLVTVELEEVDGDLEVDLDVLVYYEIDRKFAQQSAIVVAVSEGEAGSVVDLRLIGDPISAESREYYRATTISADITATLGTEADCEVRDVSAVGLAVISTQELSAGQVLPVSVWHEGREYRGDACVQSFKEWRRGRWRYGLRALGSGDEVGGLVAGLNQINLWVQREQLKRT